MRNVNDTALGIIAAVCLKYTVQCWSCMLFKAWEEWIVVQTEEVVLFSCQQINYASFFSQIGQNN